MELRYVAVVNDEFVTDKDGDVAVVIADHYPSVSDFMCSFGYDVEDDDDLEQGYEDRIEGFYIDDNGTYCFDEENCRIFYIESVDNAEAIASIIRSKSEWDFDWLRRLCKLADMEKEWEELDGESFEAVVFKAAEILKVEIL